MHQKPTLRESGVHGWSALGGTGFGKHWAEHRLPGVWRGALAAAAVRAFLLFCSWAWQLLSSGGAPRGVGLQSAQVPVRRTELSYTACHHRRHISHDYQNTVGSKLVLHQVVFTLWCLWGSELVRPPYQSWQLPHLSCNEYLSSKFDSPFPHILTLFLRATSRSLKWHGHICWCNSSYTKLLLKVYNNLYHLQKHVREPHFHIVWPALGIRKSLFFN